MSHLPIVVDPSHAAGMYWMVEPLAMAAVAVGADGLMVEGPLGTWSFYQGLRLGLQTADACLEKL